MTSFEPQQKRATWVVNGIGGGDKVPMPVSAKESLAPEPGVFKNLCSIQAPATLQAALRNEFKLPYSYFEELPRLNKPKKWEEMLRKEAAGSRQAPRVSPDGESDFDDNDSDLKLFPS